MKNQPTSTCSAESEDSLLPLDGLDLKPLDSAKSNPIAKPSLKSIGRKSQFTRTSENCGGGGQGESIYLQGVFLVSHSVLPGSEEARMMTVTSGKKCLGLSKKQTQLGLLEKMLLESSIWDCKKRLLIWKPLVMKSGYLIYQLYPSMPSIRESEFGLLPTPTASDKAYGRKPTTKRKNNAQKTNLRDVLSEKFSKNGKGGSPHPTFVEAMMGYPIGHTDLKDWATPSSRKSHTKSSKA